MSKFTAIRPPELEDCDEFLSRVRASEALHRHWVSPPSDEEQFRAYVHRMREPQNFGFLVVEQKTGNVAGVVNLTNVIFGAFRSGYLGYYAFAGFERQGLMRAGLLKVVSHSFRSLKLHRLEANIQPDNHASIALVRSCGFEREGFSKKYLKIAGRWRDHERWAIVAT
ncbi:MAG: GNAT family N-acetyltransferase [Dechloromonas sp.]|nr:GNAT family N-acetyltransferase [Dechloromonas sp.]